MNVLPVVKTLKANTELTKVLGTDPFRVFEDINDEKGFPYAVWSIIGARPENNLDCAAQIDHQYFQIIVYSKSREEASEIRALIRETLEPHCYITNIHPSYFERIADTNIFGRGFDANWWMKT